MASKSLRVTSRLAKTLARSRGVGASFCQRRWLASTTAQQRPSGEVETRVTTLDNGFRVATENTDLPTATVGLWIDAGSKYETKKTNGVAHFLEHMIFKGTERRSQHALELEVENMGAHLNAYTSREQTVYYAKCLSKDVPKAIDILQDIVMHSTFPTDSIERERGVILREMEEVDRNLQEVVMDHLHRTAFQGGPLSMTILGPEENIKGISQMNIKDYVAEHYTPDRMVLAGAGGVDHDELVKLAEQFFGQYKPSSGERTVQSSKFVGSMLKDRDDAMPLAHVCLAVEGAAWDNGDTLPLMVANTIIGNFDRTMVAGKNLGSWLASTCAADNTCHSFQAFNTCYSDTGLWGMYFVTDMENVENMVEMTQQQWMRLCDGPTPGEVERAKNLLITNQRLILDGTTPICEDIGRQMLCYGRRLSFQEMQKRIGLLVPYDIQRVMQEYVYNTAPAVAAIGPLEGLNDYTRIHNNMWSTLS